MDVPPDLGDSRQPQLTLGRLRLRSPVVLAPMAGVTDSVFRGICRRYGGGLFMSEMVIAHTLLQGASKSRLASSFASHDVPRSLQLFAVEPSSLAQAVARLVGENRVDHIDLNFGCPMPKVTRRGGGAAIPLRPRLFAAIIRAAVRNAGDVPVTAKFRIGIDDEHLSHISSGLIARDEGASGVLLHSRTAAMGYSGSARWNAILELKQAVGNFPVLGNGDIASGQDAVRMMSLTGCDGVVVGRGCLGRPWLFAELDRAILCSGSYTPPRWEHVRQLVLEHLHLAVAHRQQWDAGASAGEVELSTLRAFRKHLLWYLTPYLLEDSHAQSVCRAATAAACVADVKHCLAQIEPSTQARDASAASWRRVERDQGRVPLPNGWLQTARSEIDDLGIEPSTTSAGSSTELATKWHADPPKSIDGG